MSNETTVPAMLVAAGQKLGYLDRPRNSIEFVRAPTAQKDLWRKLADERNAAERQDVCISTQTLTLGRELDLARDEREAQVSIMADALRIVAREVVAELRAGAVAEPAPALAETTNPAELAEPAQSPRRRR